MEETPQAVCLSCGAALSGKHTKFCRQKCAATWHNAQQVWTERKDRAKRNAEKKARYDADPETWRARARNWREAHPEQYRKIANQAKERYWTSPWRKLVIAARGRAKEKGIPCDIDFAWAEETWTGFCAVSGLPFVLSAPDSHHLFSPSIDQIEPKKGYTRDNSRFVILAVNHLKHDGSDEAMYFVAEAIIKNRPNSEASKSRAR